MYGYPMFGPIPPPPYAVPGTPYPSRFAYPPVDVKIFSQSIKSFRLLMKQGSLLLDRLGDTTLARKIMEAAQQGKKAQVEQLIKSIGLKVPVTTQYTPSGVIFTLHSNISPPHPVNCCTLTISMKWGY